MNSRNKESTQLEDLIGDPHVDAPGLSALDRLQRSCQTDKDPPVRLSTALHICHKQKMSLYQWLDSLKTEQQQKSMQEGLEVDSGTAHFPESQG